MRRIVNWALADVDFAFEHSRSWSGHEHPVQLSVPSHEQIATYQMDRYLIVGQTVEHACHSARASTGSSGEGLTRTTLPNAHVHLAAVQHFDELRIHALWESRVEFEGATDFVNRIANRAVDENDGMGVSH